MIIVAPGSVSLTVSSVVNSTLDGFKSRWMMFFTWIVLGEDPSCARTRGQIERLDVVVFVSTSISYTAHSVPSSIVPICACIQRGLHRIGVDERREGQPPVRDEMRTLSSEEQTEPEDDNDLHTNALKACGEMNGIAHFF
uniref:Secreted protein n=1 Tax=Globodera pallida TaxID=36090 RepID=A0A183BK86_GLOPA